MDSENQFMLTQAIAYLKQTLPEMSKRRIPATPENYSVWYEYTTGNSPELNRAIDAHIAANLEFTEDLNKHLYETFIAKNETAAAIKIQFEVRKLIDELLKDVAQSGEGLSTFGQVLEKCSEKMAEENNIEAVKDLVSELITQTKNQEESTRAMQSSLETMAAEIQTLRKEVEKLNVTSSTDPLTRAANRAAFDTELAYAAQAANTEGGPMTLIILDIDFFKKFNDKYGHLTGDKVLKFVAAIIKQITKGQDTVARFGGEEFAVILPDTTYESALTVAENIRKKVSAQRLTDSTENKQLGSITLSAGVALYKAFESTDNLIHRADECLYAAKHAGRNQVIGEQAIKTHF